MRSLPVHCRRPRVVGALSPARGERLRRPGEGEEPVEEARICHEVVGSVYHAESRHGGPGEERGNDDGDACEKESLKCREDGRALDLDPSELEGSPDADQEGGLGAEEKREAGKQRGIVDGGGEEKGELGGDQRGPDSEKGGGLEAERVEEVGEDEADGEDGEDGGAAKVEEEGGCRGEGEGDSAIMGEGQRRDQAALGGSGGGRRGGGEEEDGEGRRRGLGLGLSDGLREEEEEGLLKVGKEGALTEEEMKVRWRAKGSSDIIVAGCGFRV
ncbi:hypothetical protein GW17_00028886 [Ensete ventricosum]|nr:hypothetical protein GW17_00028886 [Ensete ventricosum]